MADQGFNVGPNAMPGGAPEDPRVNNSALNAEMKQFRENRAQIKPGDVADILNAGSQVAVKTAQATLDEANGAMGL